MNDILVPALVPDTQFIAECIAADTATERCEATQRWLRRYEDELTSTHAQQSTLMSQAQRDGLDLILKATRVLRVMAEKKGTANG